MRERLAAGEGRQHYPGVLRVSNDDYYGVTAAGSGSGTVMTTGISSVV
jgi:hypothetical protein